jgi:hypothetical protein
MIFAELAPRSIEDVAPNGAHAFMMILAIKMSLLRSWQREKISGRLSPTRPR